MSFLFHMIIDNPFFIPGPHSTQQNSGSMSTLQWRTKATLWLSLDVDKRWGTHWPSLNTFMNPWKYFLIKVLLILNGFVNSCAICFGFYSTTVCVGFSSTTANIDCTWSSWPMVMFQREIFRTKLAKPWLAYPDT